MADTASTLASLPEERIRELVNSNIAEFFASEASWLSQITDRWIAAVENRLIERVLINRLRKALKHSGSKLDSDSLLLDMRNSYEQGTGGTFQISEQVAPATTSSTTQSGPAIDDAFIYRPNAPRTLFYLPGGGFILPSTRSQRNTAARLAAATGCDLHLAEHRLAPEHPFPAAIEDVVRQFDSLVEKGTPAHRIVLGADTAGASVMMGAIQRLREAGDEVPGAIVLFAPWCDLTLSGWSYITRSIGPSSPFRMETAAFCAKLYLAGKPAHDPLASAIHADFSGLPPILIHTSEYDLHFDDAVKLAEKARSARCPIKLNYWDSPRHHLERLNNKDAERSFREVRSFLDRHCT